MVQSLCDSDACKGRKKRNDMTKKRRRHTPEQIIRKLEEGHRQLATGMELDEVCRHLEIAPLDVASLARPVRRHEGE